MIYSTITAALAAEHIRDLQRQAHDARLTRLARCCKPSTWRAALNRTAHRRATPRGRTVACTAC
ncbi:MAG TPA: hypothetical protein VFJ09_15255 [Nocardioidaceae bacterium]|nr:hypothetical protein [Nocardioidaceae bacterium]